MIKKKCGILIDRPVININNSINGIIESLVKSIKDFNPELFRPFLYSEKVKYDANSKQAGYKFFKPMVCRADGSSTVRLRLEIETPDKSNDMQQNCFNDAVHLHSRLTIVVVESEDSI